MEEVKRKTRTRGNGQGTAFKMPNGKWRAEITLGWEELPDGKKKRIVKTKTGFKLKRDALDYISELRKGAALAATDPKITFSALYLLWSKQRYPKISKDAENGYKAAYAKCKPLYLREFASLKAADLQRVVDDAKALPTSNKSKAGETGLSRRSKENLKSLLSNMYNYALQNDYCQKNYAQYIELPKKAKSKRDAFTTEEIQKLWDDYYAGNVFTGYILIMIYTGMRYGEISTIKKDNVHLAERYMIGGIKSEAGIDREIPINEKIFPIVKEFYKANDKRLLEMHEKVFYNNFYVTLERLGIRKLPPHCCRHTTATALADANVPPAVIIAILGHEDYATTLKNYTHIKLAAMLDGINKI